MAKQFSRATTVKQELEERQREKARERERTGAVWKPVFFAQVTGNGGKPELSDEGREVLRRAQQGDWSMAGILDSKSSPGKPVEGGADGLNGLAVAA